MPFYKILIAIYLVLSSDLLLGQVTLSLDTPSTKAMIFASGIISSSQNVRDITISPNNDEVYFTVFQNGFDGNIYFIKKENNVWSLPQIASFSGNNRDLEPSFSPDGQRLYFSSRRGGSDYDIWYVERNGSEQWSSPIDIGSPINTSANEFYPSVVSDGSIYFTAEYSNGKGGEDIWYAKFLDNEYQTPISLDNVNTEFDEFNAYVSTDESVIYFGSFGRTDGFGGGDIYISRKQSNNEWGSGTNLGSRYNTNALDYSPFVSPDGKYLFFTSEKENGGIGSASNIFNLESIADDFIEPGGSNIYWIAR